jgi:hypothetical protein
MLIPRPSLSPPSHSPYTLTRCYQPEASALAEHRSVHNDMWHPATEKKFDSWSPFLSMFHTLYCMRAHTVNAKATLSIYSWKQGSNTLISGFFFFTSYMTNLAVPSLQMKHPNTDQTAKHKLNDAFSGILNDNDWKRAALTRNWV